MLLRSVVFLVFLALVTACIPPGEPAISQSVTIELSDSTTQRILDLQNIRRGEELLPYLHHANQRYRYLAARAFGSFPALSDAVADSLATLLYDPSEVVRTQAAYALGQGGRDQVTDELMAAFDQSGSYPAADAAILEAVGKLGDAKAANLLAGITTYTARDTVLLTGRVYGMLYAALRGLHFPATDAAVVDLVLNAAVPSEVRYPAAQYLQRIDFRPDSSQERRLRDLLRTTADPLIAMGVIRSLGRSERAPSRVALLRRMDALPDWRERVEILQALAGFEYASVRESVIEALRDPHPLVARTAADYLVAHGIPADAPLYFQLAEDLPAPVAIPLYGAANRHLSPFLADYRSRITGTLRERYATTTDVYERANLLLALAEFPWMYRELHTYYRAAQHPVVRTAAAESLQAIGEREDFDAFFRSSRQRVRAELAGYYRELIEGREEGPAYHAALALSAQPDTYRAIYPDLAWLDAALDRLELPRQLETYTEVLHARNALLGQERQLPTVPPQRVRPADWSLLQEYGERLVVLTTAESTITLRLWPTVAPATVSSFLRLVREGYYDDKYFHRVVPNFVAQGGGPRGDGFGSEDFVLPTETPYLHWDRAGLVGMASAGRDTEGVQFFITHRPTPHLDGKYTIFGEVVEGQEVVNRLVPGSRIESISLQ
ncbi:peptidylprolyl isomerase [Neolewinella sp.]|uniref:peptidylprolyl isomerase n=1 Tax=Neolewinella sp. TaxID=2993543 RepID=UPI003B52218F